MDTRKTILFWLVILQVADWLWLSAIISQTVTVFFLPES